MSDNYGGKIKMPRSLTWLPRPITKRIKYGRGHKKVVVVATYKRKIDGRLHTSHHIKALDRKRIAHKQYNKKEHHRTEHFSDSPLSLV